MAITVRATPWDSARDSAVGDSAWGQVAGRLVDNGCEWLVHQGVMLIMWFISGYYVDSKKKMFEKKHDVSE